MAREFLEEAGVQTDAESWFNFLDLHTKEGNLCHFFRMYTDSVFSVTTAEEEIVSVFPISRLLRDELVSNLNWIIPLCLDPRVHSDVKNTVYEHAGTVL